MLAAVCEIPPELHAATPQWEALKAAVHALRPELLLLPEMPFGPWLAESARFDAIAFECVVRGARGAAAPRTAGADRAGDPAAAARKPVRQRGLHLAGRYLSCGAHQAVLPGQRGYWEAHWFERGETHFRVDDGIGFLICTELMSTSTRAPMGVAARRSSPCRGQWAATACAVGRWRRAWPPSCPAAGAFLRPGFAGLRGPGWIINPQGDVMAQTSAATPVVAVSLDLQAARAAQKEYPCYVEELPTEADRLPGLARPAAG